MTRLLLVVALVACKGSAKEPEKVTKGPRPPAPKVENIAAPCAGVAARAREQYFDQRDRAPTAGNRSFLEHMADAVVHVYERHCTDDKWSAAAIECAKSNRPECDATLTPEQLAKLRDDPAMNL